MEDSGSTATVLQALKDMGLRIALDDFGTGYSSLSFLRRFPIDTVKIDRSFVRDMTTDADDASIVRAVIGMGESLHLCVVAEGVETREQLAFLNGMTALKGRASLRPAGCCRGICRSDGAERRNGCKRLKATKLVGTTGLLPRQSLHVPGQATCPKINRLTTPRHWPKDPIV